MFNGDLDKVIEYCKEIGVPFTDVEANGQRLVYVHQKDAYEKKQANPKKNKNLYVSYLRLSKHEGHRNLYGRYDGWCQYYNDKDIKEIIDVLEKEPASR